MRFQVTWPFIHVSSTVLGPGQTEMSKIGTVPLKSWKPEGWDEHIHSGGNVFVIETSTESFREWRRDVFILLWGLERVRKSSWRRIPVRRAWSILGRAKGADECWLWTANGVVRLSPECREHGASLLRVKESWGLRSGLCAGKQCRPVVRAQALPADRQKHSHLSSATCLPSGLGHVNWLSEPQFTPQYYIENRQPPA